MGNKKDKIEIYASRKVKGQFGWRFVSSNGRKMADGCELYHNRKDAEKAIAKLRKDFATATVVDTTPEEPKPFKLGDKVTMYNGGRKRHRGTVKRQAGTIVQCRMSDGSVRAFWLIDVKHDVKRITKAINNPVKP